MKKILISVITICLFSLCILGLASCSKEHEHTWDDGTITTEATCTEPGVITFTCTECNKTKTESISATGHNFDYNVCTNCGLEASEGLEYEFNDNREAIVTGIGACTDTDIVIPCIFNGVPVVSIKKDAFSACSDLTSITIPDNILTIGERAFSGCSSIQSINIPSSIFSIGRDAFKDCTALIQKENGIHYVDNWVIGCDNNITSAVLRNNTVGIGKYAFSGSYSSLRYITVALGNPKYHSNGNCIIETDTKTLILGCKNSIIPSDGSVTSIGDSAFIWCDSITSINIPDSITSIGESAFYDCRSLARITIPDSVTSIGNRAFENCISLTTVSFDNTSQLTSIDDYAFSNCISLASITIPDGVTIIRSRAFSSCNSLTSVVFENTTGWYLGSTSIDVSDPAINAINLVNNIGIWKRK